MQAQDEGYVTYNGVVWSHEIKHFLALCSVLVPRDVDLNQAPLPLRV